MERGPIGDGGFSYFGTNFQDLYSSEEREREREAESNELDNFTTRS